MRDGRREEDEERGGHEAGRECAGRGDGAPAGDAVVARGLDLAIVERHLGLSLDHSDLDMGVSLKAEVVVVDDTPSQFLLLFGSEQGCSIDLLEIGLEVTI